jgi:hypothetical protein
MPHFEDILKLKITLDVREVIRERRKLHSKEVNNVFSSSILLGQLSHGELDGLDIFL